MLLVVRSRFSKRIPRLLSCLASHSLAVLLAAEPQFESDERGLNCAVAGATSMLTWDVSNGVARRSWAGNANAKLAIESEMRRQDVSLAGSRCCHSPHPVKHIFAAAEQASLLLLKLLAAAEGALSAFSCQGLVVTVPEQADPSLVATYVGDDAVALEADGAKGQTTERRTDLAPASLVEMWRTAWCGPEDSRRT